METEQGSGGDNGSIVMGVGSIEMELLSVGDNVIIGDSFRWAAAQWD